MRTSWIWVVASGTALVSLVTAGRLAQQSRARAHAELNALHVIVTEARELALATASEPVWTLHNPTWMPLAEAVSQTLGQSGLPTSAMSSLSPEQAELMPGQAGQPRMQRLRAVLTLSAITLPQLGAFLDAWSEAQPGWTVTDISLTPRRGEPDAPGGHVSLHTVLTLEALRVEDRGGGA